MSRQLPTAQEERNFCSHWLTTTGNQLHHSWSHWLPKFLLLHFLWLHIPVPHDDIMDTALWASIHNKHTLIVLGMNWPRFASCSLFIYRVSMDTGMCCSRKYLYPSWKGFLGLSPPPLWKYGFKDPLPPQNFHCPFVGDGCMDIFWNYTMDWNGRRVRNG